MHFMRRCIDACEVKEEEGDGSKKKRRKNKQIPSNKSCFHLNKEAKDNRLGYLGDTEDYFSMATSVVCDNAAVRGFELLKLSGNAQIDGERDSE